MLWEYYLSPRGKRSKKFILKIPLKNNRGSAFPFYKFVLEAGLWSEMLPTAKALYPVMRCFGYFDINFYAKLEDFEIYEGDFQEEYPERKYDFCDAEISTMAEHAGIHRNSVRAALKNLAQNFLIEPLGPDCWKVFY